jgi:hypothetical protein
MLGVKTGLEWQICEVDAICEVGEMPQGSELV